MPRPIDTTTALWMAGSGANLQYTIAVDITFANETIYTHLGTGSFVNPVNGQTYVGVGYLGSISPISETMELQAQGISMTLTGIPTALMTEATSYCTGLGACTVWFVLMSQGQVAAGTTPIKQWSGYVDAPSIDVGGDTFSISLSAENRLSELSRSRGGRYSGTDQHGRYPGDTSLDKIQFLQDFALILKNTAQS